MTISKTIIHRLCVLGATAKQLAERTNIPAESIARYMNGEELPDKATLQLIGNVLWMPDKDIEALFPYCKPEPVSNWLVVEVYEGHIHSVSLAAKKAEAVAQANELLNAYAKEIGEEELQKILNRMDRDPDAVTCCSGAGFAKEGKSLTAWCNWGLEPWRAFVLPLENTLASSTVKQVVEKLLCENQHNLEDGGDDYAKGYHDALLDVLAGLSIPVDPKHGKYFD